MKYFRMLFVALFLLITSLSFAADITPTVIQTNIGVMRYYTYSWDLVSTPISSSIDADIMTQGEFIRDCVMHVTTGDAPVNLSVDIYESVDGTAYGPSVKTFTFSAAETQTWSWTVPVQKVKASVTWTDGQVSNILVYCSGNR